MPILGLIFLEILLSLNILLRINPSQIRMKVCYYILFIIIIRHFFRWIFSRRMIIFRWMSYRILLFFLPYISYLFIRALVYSLLIGIHFLSSYFLLSSQGRARIWLFSRLLIIWLGHLPSHLLVYRLSILLYPTALTGTDQTSE